MYKISIIIPVYNVENFIPLALESIKKQTIGFENLEVIFVDDCSTDNSFKLISDFSEKYDNVKSFKLDVNSGFGGAPRNLGIEKATSEYLMFLDADDVFFEDACERLYNEITTHNIDLVSGNYVKEVNGEIVKTNWNLNLINNELYVDSIDDNINLLKIPIGSMAKIYKKSLIDKYNLKFLNELPAEDLYFGYSYLFKAKGLLFIDFPVFKYVIRDSEEDKSTTFERGKKIFNGFIDGYSKIYDLCGEYNPEYYYLGAMHLHYWTMQFVKSNLSLNERIEILKHAHFMFTKFVESDKLTPAKGFESLYNKVYKKDFLGAAKDSVSIGYFYNHNYDISIIIPVFNSDKYLVDAFNSILNQTFDFNRLEVIFVDDCSKDDSVKIIKSFEDKYDNVKGVYLSENSGAAGKPRNVGMEYATSNFIMFLDPDDVFLEDACQSLYNEINSSNLDFVSGNYIFFVDGEECYPNWDDLNLNSEKRKFNSLNNTENLLTVPPSIWSKIYKRQFLLSNEIIFPENIVAQDMVFITECLVKSKSFMFIKIPIVNYSIKGSSMSAKTNKTTLSGFITSYLKTYSLVHEFNPEFEWIPIRNIYFWVKQLSLSNLSLSDKLDLLEFAKPLMDKYLSCEKLTPNGYFKPFFDYYSKDDYHNALKVSELISFEFKEKEILSKLKSQKEEVYFSAPEHVPYSNFDKLFLFDYIKTFTEAFNLLNDLDSSYWRFAITHIVNWSKDFIISDLSIKDKFELLNYSSFLFDEFKKANLSVDNNLKSFFNAMFNKNYIEAINISDSLKPLFRKDNHKQIEADDLRKHPIFLLFYGLDIKIGGLAKSVFNRANALSKKGYDVKVLNVDYSPNFNNILASQEGFKNFKALEDNIRKLDYLDDSVEIFNAFDYYSIVNDSSNFEKTANFNDLNNSSLNSLNKLNDLDLGKKISDNIFVNEKYVIEKTINSDEAISLKYYDKSVLDNETLNLKNNSNKIIKRENYSNDYLYVISHYDNSNVTADYLYTKDGYNYMIVKHMEQGNVNIFLNNRLYDYTIKFESLPKFFNYFITELCLACDKKPFLIDETSGPATNIGKLDKKIAYRLAMLHNNFYRRPFCHGGEIADFSAFSVLDNLDGVVILTEAQKNDFLREFDHDNVYVIPNFITNFELKNKCSTDKSNFNPNKISVFTRISSEKKLSDAIKAFRIIVDAKPNAILEIFGRSIKDHEIAEFNRLNKLTEELNLQNNVFFRGHVDNVTEEMRDSLCAISTSDIEGLSMVLIESMANCTSYVTYDTNYGPSDVIDNYVDGIIVEKADIKSLAKETINLLDNPQKALEMGNNARQKVLNKFSQDVVISKWEAVFDDIIAKEKIKNHKIENFKSKDNTIELNELYDKLKQINNENRVLKAKLKDISYRNQNNFNMLYDIDEEFKLKLLKQDLLNLKNKNLLLQKQLQEISSSKAWKLISPVSNVAKKMNSLDYESNK